MDSVDGPNAIPSCEHTIESGGRTAALDVSEHDRSRFESGTFLQLLRDDRSDSAKTHMAELVLLAFFGDNLFVDTCCEARSFRDDYDAKIAATSVALGNRFRDFV